MYNENQQKSALVNSFENIGHCSPSHINEKSTEIGKHINGDGQHQQAASHMKPFTDWPSHFCKQFL